MKTKTKNKNNKFYAILIFGAKFQATYPRLQQQQQRKQPSTQGTSRTKVRCCSLIAAHKFSNGERDNNGPPQ